MERSLDHHSEEFARTHRDVYRRMRSECPVAHSDQYGGFWVLTRYADCRAVLRDHDHFLSGRFRQQGRLLGGVAIPPNVMRIGMIEMDGQQARDIRALLQPWFTIQAVEGARARICQIVDWLIDNIIERGHCDVVSELSRPVPTLIIMDILGLPFEKAAWYGPVLHEAVAKTRGSADGMRWLVADLEQVIEGRAYDPDGLISAMVQAEINGQSLGVPLVCELTMMLLFGGSDTTIATISHALLHLTKCKVDRQRLIDEPSRIPNAIEEVLRLYSPTTGSARTVCKDLVIGETRLHKGDRVLCAINSANVDEAVFPNSERFDLDRPRHPHLAFGWGVHMCLGQNLARADMHILLAEVLSRLPDFEVEEASTEPYQSIPLVNGYHRMTMRFRPGSRRHSASTPGPILTEPRLRPVEREDRLNRIS